MSDEQDREANQKVGGALALIGVLFVLASVDQNNDELTVVGVAYLFFVGHWIKNNT